MCVCVCVQEHVQEWGVQEWGVQEWDVQESVRQVCVRGDRC